MRNDKHRVSEIRPSEYRYLFSFSYPAAGFPGWNVQLLDATRSGAETYMAPHYRFDYQTMNITVSWTEHKNPFGKLDYFDKSKHGSDKGGCDVCGTWFLHGDVWQHVPTGECIVLGQICASKYGLLADRDEWRKAHDMLQTGKKMEEGRKAAAIERSLRWTELMKWARENRESLPLLKVEHAITKDMRAKLVKTGAKWGLSEKQINLLKKLQADVAKGPEQHVPVPVDGERIEVLGRVVSVKDYEGPYGDVLKMVVKVETEAGSWLCYGTVPDSILGGDYGPLKGCLVSFTATVKKGNRDEYFGFFSRPTKGKVLEPAGEAVK